MSLALDAAEFMYFSSFCFSLLPVISESIINEEVCKVCKKKGWYRLHIRVYVVIYLIALQKMFFLFVFIKNSFTWISCKSMEDQNWINYPNGYMDSSKSRNVNIYNCYSYV
jgi:mRNA-degrading endonuclease RelE of RelBE toxin-antitoxin system